MHQRGKARKVWGLLGLWAALAMLMPSLLWACPMNGRVAASPELVCPCAAAGKARSTDPIAGSQHKCCHRVPMPESDTSGDGQKSLTLLVQAQKLAVAPATLHAVPVHYPQQSAVLTAVYDLTPPLAENPLPTTSPPRPFAPHFPAFTSGRAPPV